MSKKSKKQERKELFKSRSGVASTKEWFKHVFKQDISDEKAKEIDRRIEEKKDMNKFISEHKKLLNDLDNTSENFSKEDKR